MTTESTPLTVKAKSILMVDDDRLILSTISTALTSAGYQVNTAESVDKAEAWLSTNEWPDLVLLDVRMPGRNGLELTARLNEMHHIPFILLTAYSEQDIITKATESGAMSYLVKPVDITKLIPAIETALSRANYQRDLLGSNKNLQSALNADRDLSVAVGIMMVEHCTDKDGAMKLLRLKSRKQQIKLADIAAQIIDARESLVADND